MEGKSNRAYCSITESLPTNQFTDQNVLVFVVDSLMQNYGHGEVYLKKCDTCDYEQPIRTNGVHVNEGGSVMMYADHNEFVCPNCTMHTPFFESCFKENKYLFQG